MARASRAVVGSLAVTGSASASVADGEGLGEGSGVGTGACAPAVVAPGLGAGAATTGAASLELTLGLRVRGGLGVVELCPPRGEATIGSGSAGGSVTAPPAAPTKVSPS